MSDPVADARPCTDVVAAILVHADQRILLTSRPAGKVYAGYWEFPGGKVEPGETARAALERELAEELGIRVTRADPWLTRTYSYEHAHVRIRFFRVTRWEGHLQPLEGQQLAWQSVEAPTVAPMLPANAPILQALRWPDRYGITAAGVVGEAAALAGLRHALHQGVRLIQIREKDFSPARLREFALSVMALARPLGARVLLNGDAVTARAIGADGIHLDRARLATLAARPADLLCAASCHDAAALDRAEALALDFAVLGPVLATPSHPAQPALGWERFAALVAGRTLPVYALGGQTPETLAAARAAGAQGIAAIRGLMLA